tara:strand:+ start:154 stop:267 length:114 start_codon:yes stop_codon:yes gene_type:complete
MNNGMLTFKRFDHGVDFSDVALEIMGAINTIRAVSLK